MKLFWGIIRFVIRFAVLSAVLIVVLSFIDMHSGIKGLILLTFIIGFAWNAISNWRDIFRMNIIPDVGDRFYSKFYNSYGEVTRFDDRDNWWYKLDGAVNEEKAQDTPDSVKWIKRDI